MPRIVHKFRSWQTKCRLLLVNTDGATAIEYGLIAALIAVAVISGMSSLGGANGGGWGGIANRVSNVMS